MAEGTERQRRFCTNCGAEVQSGTNFCAFCGAATRSSSPQAGRTVPDAPNATRARRTENLSQRQWIDAAISHMFKGGFSVESRGDNHVTFFRRRVVIFERSVRTSLTVETVDGEVEFRTSGNDTDGRLVLEQWLAGQGRGSLSTVWLSAQQSQRLSRQADKECRAHKRFFRETRDGLIYFAKRLGNGAGNGGSASSDDLREALLHAQRGLNKVQEYARRLADLSGAELARGDGERMLAELRRAQGHVLTRLQRFQAAREVREGYDAFGENFAKWYVNRVEPLIFEPSFGGGSAR